MRVERVDVDTVKSRLENIKKSIKENSTKIIKSAEEDYSDRIALQLVEEENNKKRKREEKEARKKEQEEKDAEGIDPEIAALMGFGGFGSSKK
jgi:U4/U6.U5 tri-snRNP component SNU23